LEFNYISDYFLAGWLPEKTASAGSACGTVVTLPPAEGWTEPGCGSRPGAPC